MGFQWTDPLGLVKAFTPLQDLGLTAKPDRKAKQQQKPKAEPSPPVPAGLKSGDTFEHNGQTWRVD